MVSGNIQTLAATGTVKTHATACCFWDPVPNHQMASTTDPPAGAPPRTFELALAVVSCSRSKSLKLVLEGFSRYAFC